MPKYLRLFAFYLSFLPCLSYATELRVQKIHLSSGADLVTYFESTAPNKELPLFAVLRDSLNPDTRSDDRLRQVWVFTYSRPSLTQRLAGGVPFLYRRTGSSHATHAPAPIMDLGAPAQAVWSGVTFAALQTHLLDPFGITTRLTTRSYGGNLGEYRRTHVWEAADILAAVDNAPDGGLTPDQLRDVQMRLSLNGLLLGGIVQDEFLERSYAKDRLRRTENRGHNWDLLRQTAEHNGLYFQPLEFEGMPQSFAMIWVAEKDLDSDVRFDSQFLHIKSPYGDSELRRWTGYSEEWDLEGGKTKMIPLALYALDYPGVPYRLIDFRRLASPKRYEMTRKAADDVTTGVLGLTGFGNLSYMAAKSSYLFVAHRHGAATDRAARRRSAIQLRHALGMDTVLDPRLRSELSRLADRLAIDAIDSTWNAEEQSAWSQYCALVQTASAGGALDRLVTKGRENELLRAHHSAAARFAYKTAWVSTFGLYRHRESMTPTAEGELERQRSDSFAKRRAASPFQDVGGGQ